MWSWSTCPVIGWVFWLSFGLGLVVVFVWGPDRPTAQVYPTPDNASTLQIQDVVGHCFVVDPVPVDCPSDPTARKQIPLQGTAL
jgi:hypothetical protein